LLREAREAGVPTLFALTRSKMGQVVGPRVRISACAVLDYNGADELYHAMVGIAADGKSEWAKHHREEAARQMEEARRAKEAAEQPMMRMRFDGRVVPVGPGGAAADGSDGE
jgi:hypothetical protein